MIRLVPMTEPEYRAFLDWSIGEYAEEHTKTGRWTKEESREKSAAEHQHLLPNGLQSPDQFLATVVDETTGDRVGEVWYNRQTQGDSADLFVYWVGISPEHRRHGYATGVFQRLDEEARRLGARRVVLHVFGHNREARALYDRLGFEPINLVLAKTVPP